MQTNIDSRKKTNSTIAQMHKQDLVECLDNFLFIGTSTLVEVLNDSLYSYIETKINDKDYNRDAIINTTYHVQAVVNFIVEITHRFEVAKKFNPDLRPEYLQQT